MIFGRLPIAEAEGAFLAHAVDAGEKRLLKKGHVLTSSDIENLVRAGTETVLAARLETGDMAEDDAAGALAKPLGGANTSMKPPFTGRANLVANASGVARVNEALLREINHVDESITIACVREFEAVEEAQMIATVKIIPFAAPKNAVEKVLAILKKAPAPLLEIAPFRIRKIGVISTALPNTRASVIEKSEKIMAERLKTCGNDITFRRTTDHHEAALAEAIEDFKKEGIELILIFGASAITDRRDVIPTAITLMDGEIDHFGMPVDPGNLLLLGHIGKTTVVGLPGCTRSPKLNGFDWVLQRLLAGIDVSPSDIMDMGAGGLLKEITSRPQPRNRAASKNTAARGKSVAVLVLAAGQSRRMGPENKLLAEVEGKALLRHVIEQAKASKASGVFAVTGHERDRTEALLKDLGIKSFHNPDYAEGLSSSLKAGFAALGEEYDGIIIALGDMPRISSALFDQLIDAFDIEEGRAIIVPTWKGKRGNPVLIASEFKPEIMALAGDIGAKPLIAEHADLVHQIETGDNAIFTDVDTPEALSRIREGERGDG
ncbi:MAG: 4-diphosphocytidyl-2C-methyl-D-erythritol kinase [Alphaproteobacteria bacterium]|nr:MAG: 4-diphosphocytidyl-2C-methyl-D-erythritol kinase [Alphaproteobacteria bacterium]